MKKLLIFLPFMLLAQENNATKKPDASILYLINACSSCHGIYAEGIGSSPRLQGLREEVLLKRLKDLQAGKTRSAFGGIMISFARALDENQTIEMAKYLSTLERNDDDERYDEEYDPTSDGSS